jgi:hypothetical protein
VRTASFEFPLPGIEHMLIKKTATTLEQPMFTVRTVTLQKNRRIKNEARGTFLQEGKKECSKVLLVIFI